MNTVVASGRITVESPSGKEHEIEFNVDCTVENDGIGPYEFWGAKCNDRGTDYLVYEGVVNSMKLVFKGKDGKEIKKDLKKSNELIDSAIDKYIENHEEDICNDNAPDAPEPDFDGDYEKDEPFELEEEE